jgi:hypothetical protein
VANPAFGQKGVFKVYKISKRVQGIVLDKALKNAQKPGFLLKRDLKNCTIFV